MLRPIELEVANVVIQASAMQRVGKRGRRRLELAVLSLQRLKTLGKAPLSPPHIPGGHRARRLDRATAGLLEVDGAAAIAAIEFKDRHVGIPERVEVAPDVGVRSQQSLLGSRYRAVGYRGDELGQQRREVEQELGVVWDIDVRQDGREGIPREDATPLGQHEVWVIADR